MKILFRTLKVLSLLALSLIFLITGALVIVWMKPNLILTSARINGFIDKIPGIHFTQKPDKIDLNFDAYGFFGKDIKINIGAFCIDQPEEACFEEINLGLVFRFVKLTKIELINVGPIRLISKNLRLMPAAPKKEDEKPSKPFDWNAHLSLADDFKVHSIEVRVPLLEMMDEQNPKKVAAKINATLIAPTPDALDLDGTYQATSGLNVQAKLHSSFATPGKSPFNLVFSAKPIVAEQSTASGKVQGELIWKDLGVSLNGDLEIKKMIPWVDTLYIRHLVLERNPVLKVSADLETKLEPKINLNARDSALPKATFNTDIKGKLGLEQQKDKYNFHVKLDARPQKGLELATDVKGSLPLALDEVWFDLKIPEFQTLVNSLKRTNSAIPTPFNAMKGSIELLVGSEKSEHLDLKNPRIPIVLTTLLQSPEQQITTHSEGKIEFSSNFKKIKLDGESKIDSIRFTMPKFDILNPNVAISADSRIQSLAQIKKAADRAEKAIKAKTKQLEAPSDSSFEYTWKITSGPGAVQVFYPVLVPYAPITINWTLASAGTEGQLNLMPFQLSFLNRMANVDLLKYYYRAEDKKYHYHGKLSVPKTDYTIHIEIIDDVGSPKIILTSEPPLSDADIVSVLLFNQTTAELTPDESDSVGNTQAAIANRALGLFSIWALSSTPIEAVSYNPSSHVYSARVKLANGLTATIGTNWENSQQVELRKRLGKNFVLSTILQTENTGSGVTNVNDNADSKKALIEWFKRF